MNIETEIRQLIEKNKAMKLSISEMNNHLNIIGVLDMAQAMKDVLKCGS